jgi:hypothetical protein
MVGDIWPAHIGLGWQPTMKTGEGQAMASGRWRSTLSVSQQRGYVWNGARARPEGGGPDWGDGRGRGSAQLRRAVDRRGMV